MGIEKVFHMKGGLGDTSYSKNSSLQKRTADNVKHITVKAIEQMFIATKPKSIGIADLGCSSGPNTLSIIKLLVHTVENACRNQTVVPEFRVYLNDLPTNDFNTIFQDLPDLYRDLKKGKCHDGPHTNIYIAGCPGTFYGRLFPDDCLHFVYSSNSLHWLSRVPPGIYDDHGESINKKSIYISERSPLEVSQAYLKQFQEDFSLFLKSRSEEVVSGGRMVLIMMGRSGSQHVDDIIDANSLLWEILYQSLATLVTEGEIEEEKLDSYDVHFYAPSKQELLDEVRREGSFKVEQIEMFGTENQLSGHGVSMAVRSIQESMLAHYFGDSILNKLFQVYGMLYDQALAKHDDDHIINYTSALLHLTKL